MGEQTDFMLIIEQSETDEEAARAVAEKDELLQEKSFLENSVKRRPKVPMANVPAPPIELPPMELRIKPTTTGIRRTKFVTLAQDQNPQRGDGSFVVEYNWNIPQVEFDPVA